MNESKENVVTQYFTSEFLSYSSEAHLKENLMHALRKLEVQRLMQIFMGGPNVNWKLYDGNNAQLLRVGLYGLHIVPLTLSTGIWSSYFDPHIDFSRIHQTER